MSAPIKPDTLGDRIRRARAAKGFTQALVGEEFGISGRSVSQWETNVTKPSGDKLKRLAKLLDVSLDWIYGHTSELDGETRPKRRHGPMSKKERESEIQAFHEDGGTGVARIAEVTAHYPPPEQLKSLHDVIINRNKWCIPVDVLRNLTIENHEHLLIKRAIQDSMAPTIKPGDYMLISTAPRSLQIEGTRGIYIVNDFATVVMRRVEPVMNEGKKFYSLIPDNKESTSRLVKADKCVILGRVVGVVGFFR